MQKNVPANLSRASLRDRILSLAPSAALIRIVPTYGTAETITRLYGCDFYSLLTDRETGQEVSRLIRTHFPSADWRDPHDFHVGTASLYLTPDPTRLGFVPEDDQTFGLADSRFVARLGG